jgi:hypothetical protein
MLHMSEPKPPKPPADELAQQLKSSLAKRRPRTWMPVTAAIVLCSALLGGLVWWMYPRVPTQPLQLMAFDGVCTPDEAPTARAQLLASKAEEPAPRLSGFEMKFHEPSLVPQANAKPRQVFARSDEKGQASVEWPVGDAAVTEFFVQYIDTQRRRVSAAERGRLFVWPKDAPVLLVDADETLLAAALDDKAQATLSKAEEESWHVIYLALAGANAHDFRQARSWLENQVKLPKGPVLGRLLYPAAGTLDSARRDVLKQMKSRFSGPLLAVVKTAEAAQACRDLGLQTVLIGDADAPARVLRVATWADVPIKLK